MKKMEVAFSDDDAHNFAWSVNHNCLLEIIYVYFAFLQEQQRSCGELCHHHLAQQLLGKATHT